MSYPVQNQNVRGFLSPSVETCIVPGVIPWTRREAAPRPSEAQKKKNLDIESKPAKTM